MSGFQMLNEEGWRIGCWEKGRIKVLLETQCSVRYYRFYVESVVTQFFPLTSWTQLPATMTRLRMKYFGFNGWQLLLEIICWFISQIKHWHQSYILTQPSCELSVRYINNLNSSTFEELSSQEFHDFLSLLSVMTWYTSWVSPCWEGETGKNSHVSTTDQQ